MSKKIEKSRHVSLKKLYKSIFLFFYTNIWRIFLRIFRLPKIILRVVLKIMNPPNDFANQLVPMVDLFPALPDPVLVRYHTHIQCPPVLPCLSEAMKQGEIIDPKLGVENWFHEFLLLLLIFFLRLAGLIRHHLANESGIRSTPERYTNGSSAVNIPTLLNIQ